MKSRFWLGDLAAAQHPGLRVPGTCDGFELAVRAVVGQQITVRAARTFARTSRRRPWHAVRARAHATRAGDAVPDGDAARGVHAG